MENLALSPDGRLLATSGADHRVALRDPASLETLLDFPPWAGIPRDLTFDRGSRRLIVVGTDCNVELWDLAALKDGLAALGLAWDQPAAAGGPSPDPTAAGRRVQPEVAIVHRPGAVSTAALERAWSLAASAVVAHENGLRAEAIRDLQQARDQLRLLHQAAPGDGPTAGRLGGALTFLGGALRDDLRPTEAMEAFQQARQVFETLRQPTFVDLYNLACVQAGLAAAAKPGPTPPISAERSSPADQAMESLRRSLAAGFKDFAHMDRDHDLDSLRHRPDFHALILDRGFPSNPFAADH